MISRGEELLPIAVPTVDGLFTKFYSGPGRLFRAFTFFIAVMDWIVEKILGHHAEIIIHILTTTAMRTIFCRIFV